MEFQYREQNRSANLLIQDIFMDIRGIDFLEMRRDDYHSRHMMKFMLQFSMILI